LPNVAVKSRLKTNRRKIAIAQPDTGEEEWQALRQPIMTGWLTQGPKVAAFERTFTELHGVQHAIAVTSCTTGLHLTLAALGIGPGDEVIVPAFTWVATANVVLHCGATPIFVDIDRRTFNIDTALIADKVTERTKAIIPVHLFGLCADIDAVKAAIPEHVKVIEDAACAAGAIYKGRYAGGLGEAAVFSFHPRKSITTGEGGMITTNDDELAERISAMRNHGASISEEQRHHGPRPYLLPDFNLLGFNYRMTDLQGAVGLVQLGKLEHLIQERAKWAAYYRDKLASLDWLQLPEEPVDGRHGWQAFVVYVHPEKAPQARNDMMKWLQDKDIATRPGTHAVPILGYYRKRFGLDVDDYPATCDCDRNSMAIPLHNRMADQDYSQVVEAIRAL